MAAISKITLPSGSTYDLHDSRVDSINNWQYVVCTNAANTPKDVTWGSGASAVTGTLVASADTMYKIYLVPSENGTNDIYDEYITVNSSGTTYVWEMFGNTKLPDMTQYVKNKSGHTGETAGDLAYKNTASGSVDVPKTFTTTITPAAKDVSVTGTTTGSVSLTKSTVDVKPNSTGTAANKYTPGGSVSSSFTGSATTSTGKFTPSGSVGFTNTNKTATVSAAGSGEATYTPAGSVSTPTITVTPSTTTKYVASSATGGGSVTAGSAASCTMPTYTVSGETLTITAGSFTANTPTAVTLPTFASQTIATGITSATSTQPSFTGTGARLVTSNISVPTSASFTGTEGNVSVSGTPEGSVSSTFTGTDTYLKTAVEVGTGASFTGASMTSTGSYTPAAGSASTTVATTESKTVTVS